MAITAIKQQAQPVGKLNRSSRSTPGWQPPRRAEVMVQNRPSINRWPRMLRRNRYRRPAVGARMRQRSGNFDGGGSRIVAIKGANGFRDSGGCFLSRVQPVSAPPGRVPGRTEDTRSHTEKFSNSHSKVKNQHQDAKTGGSTHSSHIFQGRGHL